MCRGFSSVSPSKDPLAVGTSDFNSPCHQFLRMEGGLRGGVWHELR